MYEVLSETFPCAVPPEALRLEGVLADGSLPFPAMLGYNDPDYPNHGHVLLLTLVQSCEVGARRGVRYGHRDLSAVGP